MAIVRVDALRTISSGSITNSYAAFGSALTHSWRIFKITNVTDGNMLFSFDSTTDNIFVPANSFSIYDLSTNAPPISEVDNLVFGIGTQFYIKYNTAPTTGSVWLEGIYAKGE